MPAKRTVQLPRNADHLMAWAFIPLSVLQIAYGLEKSDNFERNYPIKLDREAREENNFAGFGLSFMPDHAVGLIPDARDLPILAGYLHAL